MQKQKLCRIISTALLFIIVIQGNIYANSNVTVEKKIEHSICQPCFTNIVLFQNDFDISDSGKASITSTLTAQNVNKVIIIANLQQYKNGVWTTIKSWTNTSNSTYVAMSKSYYVTKGYSYRLASEGKAYIDGSLVERTSYVSQTINY